VRRSSRMKTPRVAITMGDPAGVGAEVILKAIARPAVRRACEPVIFGDLAWLRRVQKSVLKRHPGGRLVLAGPVVPRQAVRVVDFGNVPASGVRFGEASEAGGRASGEYVSTAVD